MPNKERKKELIRAYKESPKTIGVYCIRNLQNHKIYVGISQDVEARINRHRFELNNNSERELQELQSDWQTSGHEAFEFSVLAQMQPENEEDVETWLDTQYLNWCEKLQSMVPNGYNP